MIIFLYEKDKTEENLKLSEEYDFYIGAIDNLRQYRDAENKNKSILKQLYKNGVQSVMFKYEPMMSSTEVERIIDLSKDI